MSLITLTLAGSAFILIGTFQSLLHNSTPKSQNPKFHVSIFLISLSFLVNSLLSLADSISLNDHIGTALQLQILSIAAFFLLYALLGILSLTRVVPFPSSLLNLVMLFGFLEEFVLFYMQRKDTVGIENHYFDLMLFPIGVCLVSTLMELSSSDSSNVNYVKLARGVGMILQGTWLVQMGISFYTSMLVQGCMLREKSRGNYTIRCKGHDEYHRGRAIATLQFNCHLAFMVVVVVGLFSVLSDKGCLVKSGEGLIYRPIGAEMLPLEQTDKFTLDSDDNEDVHSDHGDENGLVEKAFDVGAKEPEDHI